MKDAATLDKSVKLTPAAKRKEIARLNGMAAHCQANLKNARARVQRGNPYMAKYGLDAATVKHYKHELMLIRAAIAKVEGK